MDAAAPGAGLTAPVWLSIVIPARNDAEALGRTLGHLQGLPGRPCVEMIVAAAGDAAGTERAVAGRAHLLRPPSSTRAELMNTGAAAARGQVLFFLHADSFPPVEAPALIAAALADARVVGGAFEHRFAEPVWSLTTIIWINRLRYRLTRNYYGDQGQFVRAPVFRGLGGYRELKLMEDREFAQRLKRGLRLIAARWLGFRGERLVHHPRLYVLETPLFRVRNKDRTVYCYSEEERDQAMKALGGKTEITRFKGLGDAQLTQPVHVEHAPDAAAVGGAEPVPDRREVDRPVGHEPLAVRQLRQAGLAHDDLRPRTLEPPAHRLAEAEARGRRDRLDGVGAVRSHAGRR